MYSTRRRGSRFNAQSLRFKILEDLFRVYGPGLWTCGVGLGFRV